MVGKTIASMDVPPVTTWHAIDSKSGVLFNVLTKTVLDIANLCDATWQYNSLAAVMCWENVVTSLAGTNLIHFVFQLGLS